MDFERSLLYHADEPTGASGQPLEDDFSLDANFRGDWIKVLEERINTGESEDKFVSFCRVNSESVNFNEEGVRNFYRKNVQGVFSPTALISSQSVKANQVSVGMGEINGPGMVFTDATYQGRPLSDFEINIAVAHEKMHGILSCDNISKAKYVTLPFDLYAYTGSEREAVFNEESMKYLADEFVARMSQLKNYFQMRTGQVFKLKHLEYARENYVADVGFDNNMTRFFSAIKDGNKFVDTINSVPC